jgi:hypothetical protein
MSDSNSSDSSSCNSPRWQISFRICDGAYEDCPHCNGDGGCDDHSDNDKSTESRKYVIRLGMYVDNDDTDNDDHSDHSSHSNSHLSSFAGSQIEKTQIETKEASKTQSEPAEEVKEEAEVAATDDSQPEETQSIGTQFTYDEIDPETGNITRHCPSARELHQFLWGGRDFLRKENQHTYIQTPESCRHSVKMWGASIAYVRDEFITFDLCKRAVKKDGYAIRCINRTLLTPEEYYQLALIAVKQNGFCFSEVPGDIQTQELCDAAVESSCWALPYCYRDFRTPALCLSAVSRNGQTLQHCPEEHITPELCLAAIKSGYECMEYVPRKYITYELCKAAVEASGRNIEHVPEELMSSEIGLAAVKTSGQNEAYSMAGNNIRFIPAKYMTKEIILEAMKSCPHSYSHIPKEILSDEINDAILEQRPISIVWMEQTPAHLIKAVQCDLNVLQHIKKSVITKEIAEYITALPDAQEKFDTESWDYLKTLVSAETDY